MIHLYTFRIMFTSSKELTAEEQNQILLETRASLKFPRVETMGMQEINFDDLLGEAG